MSQESSEPRRFMRKKQTIPLIIERSPIEFVLVGPKGSDHGIVARSRESQIDLIGFAASQRDTLNMGNSSISANVLALLLRFPPFGRIMKSRLMIEPREMNAVTSRLVDPIEPEIDSRMQRYRFCWVGECTFAERIDIEEMFNRQLPDIREALKKSESELAEWALSPIILECSVCIVKQERRRLPIRFFLATYMSSFMIALFFAMFYMVIQAARYLHLIPSG